MKFSFLSLCLLITGNCFAQLPVVPLQQFAQSSGGGGGGPTVPAYVGSSHTNNGASSYSTARVVITNTAGDFLFAVGLWAQPSSTSISISDSLGNTWTPISGQILWDNSAVITYTFYATNCASGSNQVVITCSAGSATYGALAVSEYSGVKLYHPLDVQTFSSGTTSASNQTKSTGNATTTVNGDLLIATSASTPGGVDTAVNGYTGRVSDSNFIFDQVQSTASATTTGSVQIGTSGDYYYISLAAFLHQ